MGDDENGAGIIAQMAFEPCHRLGVEVVGRLVEQEKFGRFEQKPAQRDAAPLAAGEFCDVGLIEWAAQRVHRLIDLGIEIPQPLGLDLVLELGHFVGGCVGIIGGKLVVAIENRLLRRQAFHDVVADRFRRIELRLLRQVADAGAGCRPGLAAIFGVEPGHDAEQGRFTGAVDAKNANLRIGIEGQIDILQDLPVPRISLGQAFHMIDELTGH